MNCFLLILLVFMVFFYLPRLAKKVNACRKEYQQRIQAEGGQILKERRIGLFIVSPFMKLRSQPHYYEYKVKYPDKQGSWYIAFSLG